jgi:hypothetical protein
VGTGPDARIVACSKIHKAGWLWIENSFENKGFAALKTVGGGV